MHHHDMPMSSEESSGTSWQPASSPMEGIHTSYKDWSLMFHGFANGIYTSQGGPRGRDKLFSTSMFMAGADKVSGANKIALRGMLSLDPAMGRKGYPLLLQTGETYDGIHPLIDRQHPHDLFMELSAAYTREFSDDKSGYIYFGLPGEPALGPPTFMHRFSGADNPEAPLGHHWLDSTHITYGVVTLGYVWDKMKIEASSFRGREPDEDRWDMETPGFDSYSFRLSYNPAPDWSFQASYGHLYSPEQLEPWVNVDRYTVSAMYNKPLEDGNWQTTFAWGRNVKDPGKGTDAYLLESAVNFKKKHTVFGRFESVKKDELFEHDDPLAGRAYRVYKVSTGYVFDFVEVKDVKFGVGGEVGVDFVPGAIKDAYDSDPVSYLVFIRAKL